MQRIAYFAGGIVVGAAAILVWSHVTMVQPQASTASLIGGPGKAASSEAAVTISPLDMMRTYKGFLPVQRVDNPI